MTCSDTQVLSISSGELGEILTEASGNAIGYVAFEPLTGEHDE